MAEIHPSLADRAYRVITKIALAAAVILAVLTAVAMVVFDTSALLPLLGVAVAAAFYILWRMSSAEG